MPSPFPGVDPYIESQWYWRDFRHRMLTYCRDMLFEVLPDRYDARLDWRHEEREGVRQTYLKVLTRPERTLVTVVELLYRENKTFPARKLYLEDREDWLKQAVNLVELDLVLGGQRLPVRGALPPGDYYAFISRWDRRPTSEVYIWTVRDRLPLLRVPLRTSDADALLDLNAVYKRVYESGHYCEVLDYDTPLRARLSPDNLQWATELARNRTTDV